MARTLPDFGEELVQEIEAAWAQPQADWARQRLLVVRLIAQHEMTSAQIAQVAGVSRKSVFNYRDTVLQEGVAGLLSRDWAGGRTPVVRGAVAEEFVQRLEAGQFRQARDAQAWIKKRTRRKISESGAHASELLFTPAIDRDIHALFLRQIADSDPGALHIVIQDQAGFHLPEADPRLPANLRLLPLPPYCPELNPVERFGGLLKAQVRNRLYPNLRKLEDHLAAAARRWTTPDKVSGLIHTWLAEQVNAGALT